MSYVITGGRGFLDSNIAARLMSKKEKVVVFDNLYRPGAEKKLEWMKQQGRVASASCDVRNRNDVERIACEEKPMVIYHLVGQVAMTTSIANPEMNFEINALGLFHMLDSVRRYSSERPRGSGQKVFVADIPKIHSYIQWAPKIDKFSGIRKVQEWSRAHV